MASPRTGIFALGTAAHAYLESMVGSTSEPPDQLTSVARAVTGAYYVIPTADRLAAFGAEDRL